MAWNTFLTITGIVTAILILYGFTYLIVDSIMKMINKKNKQDDKK